MAKAKKRPAKKKPTKKTAVKKKPAKKKVTKKAAKKVSAKKTAKKPAKKTAKKASPQKKAAKKTSKPVQKAAPKKVAANKTTALKKAALDKLIHPLSDRLVVQVEGPSEKTAGGLYIPANVEDRPNQGVVLACGPGAKSKKGNLKPLDVKVGDKVIFNTYAGVQAQLQGQDVLILREDEVLGILS